MASTSLYGRQRRSNERVESPFTLFRRGGSGRVHAHRDAAHLHLVGASMRRKAAVWVLLIFITVPTLSFGQVMSGTVGLLGFGPGWYAGAQRVIQATVTRAGVTEVANIALTTTARGLLASAVIAAMIIAEPAFNSGVDAIRTWIATAGISRMASGGIGKAATTDIGPKQFIPGTADATSFRLFRRSWQWSYAGVRLEGV